MHARTHTAPSAPALRSLAAQWGQACQGGEIWALDGPLGAGKTEFVKGLAQGLNVHQDTNPVTSPTFGLVHEYPGRLPLTHLDFYRLNSPSEVLALGWDELCEATGVIAVEWASLFPELFHGHRNVNWVHIDITDQGRILTIRPTPNAASY